jgi:hypothetical protein
LLRPFGCVSLRSKVVNESVVLEMFEWEFEPRMTRMGTDEDPKETP